MNTVEYKNMGEKIKMLRKGKKMTQKALAEALQVTRVTLGMWEIGKGRPKLDNIQKIADFFGKKVTYFFK